MLNFFHTVRINNRAPHRCLLSHCVLGPVLTQWLRHRYNSPGSKMAESHEVLRGRWLGFSGSSLLHQNFLPKPDEVKLPKIDAGAEASSRNQQLSLVAREVILRLNPPCVTRWPQIHTSAPTLIDSLYTLGSPSSLLQRCAELLPYAPYQKSCPSWFFGHCVIGDSGR